MQSLRKKKKEKDALYIPSGVHAGGRARGLYAGVYASVYAGVYADIYAGVHAGKHAGVQVLVRECMLVYLHMCLWNALQKLGRGIAIAREQGPRCSSEA